MYKYFSSLLLFSVLNGHAQCSLSFDQLDKSSNYTLSEFETFAQTNGYTFNADNDAFICDTPYQNTAYLQLIRTVTEERHILVQNIFFSKSIYSDYKSVLESKGSLQDSDVNSGLTLQYIYDDRLVTLQTKILNSMAVYFITISNERLK